MSVNILTFNLVLAVLPFNLLIIVPQSDEIVHIFLILYVYEAMFYPLEAGVTINYLSTVAE
jgi:hypothetical protein